MKNCILLFLFIPYTVKAQYSFYLTGGKAFGVDIIEKVEPINGFNLKLGMDYAVLNFLDINAEYNYQNCLSNYFSFAADDPYFKYTKPNQIHGVFLGIKFTNKSRLFYVKLAAGLVQNKFQNAEKNNPNHPEDNFELVGDKISQTMLMFEPGLNLKVYQNLHVNIYCALNTATKSKIRTIKAYHATYGEDYLVLEQFTSIVNFGAGLTYRINKKPKS